ncbi:MAG: hypothetical protein ACI4B5_01840 [Bacteroidaceae bacterium]
MNDLGLGQMRGNLLWDLGCQRKRKSAFLAVEGKQGMKSDFPAGKTKDNKG